MALKVEKEKKIADEHGFGDKEEAFDATVKVLEETLKELRENPEIEMSCILLISKSVDEQFEEGKSGAMIKMFGSGQADMQALLIEKFLETNQEVSREYLIQKLSKLDGIINKISDIKKSHSEEESSEDKPQN